MYATKKTWITLLGWAAVLCGLLTSCGGVTKDNAQTRVDGATVSLSQRYRDQDAGNYEITVTPSSMPASTMPAQPVVIKVDGREVTAPAGSGVTMKSTSPASTVVENSADATGATFRTTGDKGQHDGSAPAVELPGQTIKGIGGRGTKGGGGSASGGDISTVWTQITTVLSTSSSGQKALWIVGVLSLLAAVAYLLFEQFWDGKPDWMIAGILGAFGLFMIGLGIIAESHPWMLALIPIFIIVAGGYYVWQWKKKESPTVPAAPGIVNSSNGVSV